MSKVISIQGSHRLRSPSVPSHDVRFYEDDEFLAQEVARYFASALRGGHAGLMIARPGLRQAVQELLRGEGLHPAADELPMLDAQQTLDAFMVEGWPDEERFRRAVLPQLARGCAGGRTLFAFGEMVALLCEQGQQQAAVRLEELWNALQGVHSFSLLCAYPLRLFAGDPAGRAFQHICAAHHRVAPTERAAVPSSDAHGLTLAQLEHKALALEHALAERDRLLDGLAEAGRAKDEFLAMLGHELRNPLAPIITALELMKLRGSGSTEREQALIRRQVDHLQRLVDDLLDVSRLTRGEIRLARQSCKLADVLARAVEMAGPLIEQGRHELTIELQEPELRCDADAARLAQVFANLLTNAARYTPPGGRIALAAGRAGDELQVSVADNGVGLDAAMLEPIFTMFQQGRQGVDRREGGLGIGLALVRSLVRLHGGRVWAESEGRGHGSRFLLRLPLAAQGIPAQPQQAHPPPDLSAAAPAGGQRVLVVDDNREAADFLAELLRAYGNEVCVAYDPAQALQQLEHYRPQVAILDIGLPVMDGYELAGRVRERLGAQACRLFALTGYGLPADRQRSASAGFERHLVKPVEASEIAALISPR